MRPPPWSDDERGIELSAPPICGRCKDSPSLSLGLGDNPAGLVGRDGSDDRGASGRDHAVAKKGSRSLLKRASDGWRRLTEVQGEEDAGPGDASDASRTVKRKRKGGEHGDAFVEKRRRGDQDIVIKESLWASDGTVADKELAAKNLPDLVGLSSHARKGNDTIGRRPTGVTPEDPVPASAPSNHISIFAPLDHTQTYGASRYKPLPHWMSLLPSNRGDQSPRRPSAPVNLPSRASLIGSTPSLDTKLPPTGADQSPTEQSPEIRSTQRRQTFPECSMLPREPTNFPFFQNPRPLITPAIDSSWGTASPRRGITPATKVRATTATNCVGRHVLEGPRASETGFHSKEYLEKYSQSAPVTSSDHAAVSDLDMCPCCSTPVTSSERLLGSNGRVYHSECFTCRICGAGFVSAERMIDGIFLKQQPYHIACVKAKAPALAEKLKGTESTKKDRLEDAVGPKKSSSRLSWKKAVMDAAGTGTSTGATSTSLGTAPALLKELSGLFSTRKKPLPALGGFDGSCASCGRGLTHLESVPGPRNTRFHGLCMRCHGCERMLESGTSWYEWSDTGLMEPSCRRCWRTRRLKRGYRSEDIDSEEMGLGFMGWKRT